jgi:outer membrane protein TolC
MIAPLLAALALTVTAPAPSAPALTLDAALKQASERNLDLQAAQSRLTQARELSRKAWSGYLPQVTASGTYMYNSTEAKLGMPTGYVIKDVGVPTSAPADPGQPVSPVNPGPTPYVMMPSGFSEMVIQAQHQFSGQLQVTQTLFAPALWASASAASTAFEMTALGVETARREVLFGTAQLYYGAVGLQQAVEIQKRLLLASREHEKDARTRFAAGSVTQVAVLRAQIEVARGEQDVRRAELAYQSAKSALATLLDRAPDFEVARPPAPPAVDRSVDLSAQAMRDRPDIQAAKVAVGLAETNHRATLYRYFPMLAAFARYQGSNTKGFTGEQTSWVAGLSLNWNLFDGGLREAELRDSDARIAESVATSRAVEARARDEVRRALLDLASAEANRVKAEEQVKLATEAVRLTDKSYQAGAASSLERVDAETGLAAAELAVVAETLNAELAVVRLAKVAGRPLTR